jgi:hypothetical protein
MEPFSGDGYELCRQKKRQPDQGRQSLNIKYPLADRERAEDTAKSQKSSFGIFSGLFVFSWSGIDIALLLQFTATEIMLEQSLRMDK